MSQLHLPDASFLVEAAILIIGALAMSRAYFRANYSRDTINILTDSQKARDDRIKLLEANDKENKRQIAHLSGQVDVLKTIPLKGIEESIATMSKSIGAMSKAVDVLTAHLSSHDESVVKSTAKIIEHIDQIAKGLKR